MQNEFFEASEPPMQGDAARPPPGIHRADIIKAIQGMAHRHDTWRVFCDFVELAALTISNSVDRSQFDVREARYMDIIKRYTREEANEFARMFAELVMELETETSDVLGTVFHELELHSKFRGQYFTPMPLARVMAKLTIGDAEHLNSLIEQNGCIRAAEDACGSGVMVIALAEEMREMGVNYQQWLHVTATDVDAKCAHMVFVQLSLLHIPAIVVHGNSLSLEEFEQWYTPAHILGGWNWRLRTRADAAYGPPVAIETPTERPSDNTAPGMQLHLF